MITALFFYPLHGYTFLTPGTEHTNRPVALASAPKPMDMLASLLAMMSIAHQHIMDALHARFPRPVVNTLEMRTQDLLQGSEFWLLRFFTLQIITK